MMMPWKSKHPYFLEKTFRVPMSQGLFMVIIISPTPLQKVTIMSQL
jgi:hypothetical protein